MLDVIKEWHSISCPFLNTDWPALKTPHTFDLTNGFNLKDSWPCKISICKFPLLVEVSLPFINLVKFFFLTNLFFNLALNGFSSFILRTAERKGYTKNLKHAAEEIGLPGRPKKLFLYF